MFNSKKLIQSSAVSCAIAFILGTPVVSAIEITSTLDSDALANALIIPGSGVTITSSGLFGGVEAGDYGGDNGGDYGGAPQFSSFNVDVGGFDPVGQAGIFTNNSGVYGLPSSGGVVFSSGNVSDYEDGTNDSDANSGGNGYAASEEQNTILSEITG